MNKATKMARIKLAKAKTAFVNSRKPPIKAYVPCENTSKSRKSEAEWLKVAQEETANARARWEEKNNLLREQASQTILEGWKEIELNRLQAWRAAERAKKAAAIAMEAAIRLQKVADEAVAELNRLLGK